MSLRLGPTGRSAAIVALAAAVLALGLAALAMRHEAREALLAAMAVVATSAAALLVLRARAQTGQARAETAAALTRLQAIIDSMADGVIFVDAEDRIALVNEAGRVLRNLAGGPGRPVKECHPEAMHLMLERVLRWFREGKDTGPGHSIIKEKEGRWETAYAPVRARDGTAFTALPSPRSSLRKYLRIPPSAPSRSAIPSWRRS